MPSISTCPHCCSTILVASLANLDQRLRCPLCAQVFTVEQVASGSAAAPPEALPVEPELSEGVPAVSEAPVQEAPVEAPVEEVAAVEASPVAEAPAVERPDGEVAADQGAVEAVAAVETAEAGETVESVTEAGAVEAEPVATSEGELTGEPAAVESEAVGVATDEVLAELPAPSSVPLWLSGDDWSMSSRAVAYQADTAEAEAAAGEAVEEEQVDEEGELVGAAAESEPSAYVTQRPRGRRTSGGSGGMKMLVQFGGVVGGGITGIILGYLVLLWIGGPENPFVRMIQEKLPDFLVFRFSDRGQLQSVPEGRSLADLLRTPKADEAAASPTDSGVRLASHTASMPPPVSPLEVAGVMQPRRFTPASVQELSQLLEDGDRALGCELCNSTGYVVVAGLRPSHDSATARSPTAGDAAPSGRETSGRTGGGVGDPRRTPADQRVRCPRCQGRSSGKLTPEVYQRLCRLAEAATFVRIEPGDAEVSQRRQAVRSTLLRACSDQHRAEAVGRLAAQCLSGSQREGNGIVVAGTVQEAAAEPFGHRLTIVLFGTPKLVQVYAQHAPQPSLARGDRVLVVGSIVDSPAVNLTGYVGTLPQVIWGGLAVRLDDAQP